MKKIKLAVGTILLALGLMVSPVAVAVGQTFEKLNFQIDYAPDKTFADSDFAVLASVEETPEKMENRTDEFNIEDYVWSLCKDDECADFEDLRSDAKFEENKNYVIRITISALNGSEIDIWSPKDVMINGITVEEMRGETNNDGAKLVVKAKVLNVPVQTALVDDDDPAPAKGTDTTLRGCFLGLPLCCVDLVGISACAWILIGVVLLAAATVIITIARRKKARTKNSESKTED